MTIITQEYEKNQACESRISRFFSCYKIGDMLRKCGAGKEKGIAIVQIFRYLLCLMFSDRTFYIVNMAEINRILDILLIEKNFDMTLRNIGNGVNKIGNEVNAL